MRASIASCSSSNGAFGRSSPRRVADARHVRVDRHVAQAEGEQQHAGGGLAPDARQRAEVRLRLLRPARRASTSSSSGSPIARRIAWIRADFTFEMPPGRIASSTSSSGASRTASQRREALAQAQVRDVAVAVVRGLRQDRQDELGDRVAVRRQRGHAVDLGEPLADPRDPRARPALPGRPRGARARRGHSSAPQRSQARAASSAASGSAAASAAGSSRSRRARASSDAEEDVAGADGADDARRLRRATSSFIPFARRIAPPAPRVTIDVLRAAGEQRRRRGLGMRLAGHQPRLGLVALDEERPRHARAGRGARAAGVAAPAVQAHVGIEDDRPAELQRARAGGHRELRLGRSGERVGA